MAITVGELVAEPQLGLTLLAGAAGLENRITWLTPRTFPDCGSGSRAANS